MPTPISLLQQTQTELQLRFQTAIDQLARTSEQPPSHSFTPVYVHVQPYRFGFDVKAGLSMGAQPLDPSLASTASWLAMFPPSNDEDLPAAQRLTAPTPFDLPILHLQAPSIDALLGAFDSHLALLTRSFSCLQLSTPDPRSISTALDLCRAQLLRLPHSLPTPDPLTFDTNPLSPPFRIHADSALEHFITHQQAPSRLALIQHQITTPLSHDYVIYRTLLAHVHISSVLSPDSSPLPFLRISAFEPFRADYPDCACIPLHTLSLSQWGPFLTSHIFIR